MLQKLQIIIFIFIIHADLQALLQQSESDSVSEKSLLQQIHDLETSKNKVISKLQTVQTEYDECNKENVELKHELQKTVADLEGLQEQVKQSQMEEKVQKEEVVPLGASPDKVKEVEEKLTAKAKQLKETEDKAQKLKSLAVKAKKELELSKKQVRNHYSMTISKVVGLFTS